MQIFPLDPGTDAACPCCGAITFLARSATAPVHCDRCGATVEEPAPITRREGARYHAPVRLSDPYESDWLE